MKFQFLTENFSRSENAPPFETRKIRHFEVKRIFLKNKKMLEDFLQSLFRKCGFSWFALLFCAPTFAKLRSCGASKFFCLQRGSGRLIKSNVAPKLCDHWHNFICSPVADGAKNNCDFAGFDLNGNLHNKSSHAPVKTAKKSYFAI